MPLGPFRYVSPDDDDLGWEGDPDQRRAQHRWQIIALSIVIAGTVVASATIEPYILSFNFFLVPFLLLEVWMYRRSGRSRIPDYRPTDRVDVELDPD